MATGISVSVHLDEKAGRRVEKAASLVKQSRSAFVERVADEAARRIVLAWAVAEYRRGERTYGELAEETGLTIEEIMMGMTEIPEDPTAVVDDLPEPWLYEAVARVMERLRRQT
jgi:DNA-binding transcriptional ArsR family regulator